MPDDQLSSVRAQIKSWEREFKSIHGLDPSIQDIKALPAIAEQYKLYKKLSKAAVAAPSTPPRRDTSIILSKPRVVQPTPPLAIFNPFSPVKKSPPEKSAVFRARKRLRGEPVSPSPNKDKRRRVGSLPCANLASDHEDDDDEGPEANSSFVDDSPVKAPAGVKSFKLLFEETVPKIDVTTAKRKPSLSRSKTTPASASLFGHRNPSQSTLIKDDTVQILGTKRVDRHPKNGIMPASSSLPTTVHLFSGSHALPHDNPQMPVLPSRKYATKRSLSDVDDYPEGEDLITRVDEVTAVPKLSLLPPSPPTVDSARTNISSRGKGKGKAVARKKPKIHPGDEDNEDANSSVDETRVRLVITNGYQRTTSSSVAAVAVGDEDDPDPILRHYDLLHRGSHEQAHHTSAYSPNRSQTQTNPEPTPQSGTLALPDKFHHMLSISPSLSSARDAERVVRGLVSGVRAVHYDPAKGGEIWGVGEQEDQGAGWGVAGEGEGGEEEWEGEGVPWEAGEL